MIREFRRRNRESTRENNLYQKDPVSHPSLIEPPLPRPGVGMILNHVSSRVLSGLIETLAGPPYNGHADLPVLASSLQLEADEIFHLGESLQLLRFAQLSEGDLMLTDAGKRFAHLETDARRKLFAEHLINYVQMATAQITAMRSSAG